MPIQKLNFNYNYLINTLSTNIHALKMAKEENLPEGELYIATNQTEGKGQRGAKWLSENAKNLNISFLLRPNLKADQQFILAQTIALALHRYMDNLSVGEVRIKWPNDTLINGKKVAGTLIENVLAGDKIQYAIVGIGINVNQVDFPEFPREATSLKLLSNREHFLSIELENLLEYISSTYSFLQHGEEELIKKEYMKRLYGYDQALRFKDEDGEFMGKVVKIQPSGKIILDRAGEKKTYDMKEVVFID